MKNRVVVNIGGRAYTILADESEEYVQKVSTYVDGKVAEITVGNRISNQDAIMLAALNICDEYFKSLELNDSLRAQLKACLDEASEARAQVTHLRRQLQEYTELN